MKVKFKLIDVLMVLLGETRELPNEYRKRAVAIDRSLKTGKWRITSTG